MRGSCATALVLFVICQLGCGCGDPTTTPATRELGDARVGGEIVATVDGHAITVADVEAFVRVEGGTASDALRELIEEELLAQEAERLGYGRRASVRRETRRATVQALLATIEVEHPASAISDEALRDAYDGAGERFVIPEKRRCDHVLVRVEDANREREARRVASTVLAELERDPEALATIRAETSREGFPLLVEELPLVARDGSLERPFEDVLFAGAEPGVRAELARTSYGWHVVIVREIVPGTRRTFDDASAELREELTNRRRFEALTELLGRLHEDRGVELRPGGVEAAQRVEVDE